MQLDHVFSLRGHIIALLSSNCVRNFADNEAWLPTVEELFKVQEATPADKFVVEEFWSMDCLNRG